MTQLSLQEQLRAYIDLLESTSVESTIRSITAIADSITQVYEMQKRMADTWIKNHNTLKNGFHRNSGGASARWVNDFYFNKLQSELYSLCKFAPKATRELASTLSDFGAERP